MATPRGAATFRAPADAYDRHIGRYGPRPGAGAGATPPASRRDSARWTSGAARVRWRPSSCGGSASTRSRRSIRRRRSWRGAAARLPGLRVEEAVAERLPFPDASFDRALAQLVVNFMTDAPAGVGEMGRVTRPGGVVGAAVWDYAGGDDAAAGVLGRGGRARPRGGGARRGALDAVLHAGGPRGAVVGGRPGRRARRRGRGRGATTTGSTTSGAAGGGRRARGRLRAGRWTSTAARHSRTSCSGGSASGRGRSASPRGHGWRRASGR